MFGFFSMDTLSTSELYPFPFVGQSPWQSPWLAQPFKMVAAPIPPIQQQKAPASTFQAQ